MLKKLCLIISCLLPIVGNAIENQNLGNFNMVNSLDDTEALLKATTLRYLDFINRIGSGETFPQQEEASMLLSADCKKVLNGQLFTASREEFVNDLLSLYKNQVGWKVSPADIIIAAKSNTVVLRLFIEMDNSGTYTTIVILRYNSNFLISEINEVLNEVKGSYGFK